MVSGDVVIEEEWRSVIFFQVSILLSGRTREFRDDVSGLPTGLDKGFWAGEVRTRDGDVFATAAICPS